MKDKQTCQRSILGQAAISRGVRVGLPTLVGILALGPRAALAHGDSPPAPHDLWSSWNREPVLLLSLAVAAWLYARGVRTLWKRAGVGRGVRRWQAACFAIGLIALFVALVSPLDALGAALFSAHMAQHLVLILIAAPLLVLGAPAVPLLWAFPLSWRHRIVSWQRNIVLRSTWRTLTRSGMVWVLHIGVVWIWHSPGLYQAALRSELIHVLEHSGFLATAVLFWWIIIHPAGHRRPNYEYGTGLLYIFATAVANGLLGALITFAPAPWYPAYAASTAAWNLTPLEDQQLAGLIMWVPPSVFYTAAASILLVAWISVYESRMEHVGQVRRRSQAHEVKMEGQNSPANTIPATHAGEK